MAKKKKSGKKKRPKKVKVKAVGYSKVQKVIFIRGKQKKVYREYMDGIPLDEWEWRNMDPIAALEGGHYDRLYEFEQQHYPPAPMPEEPTPKREKTKTPGAANTRPDDDLDLPF